MTKRISMLVALVLGAGCGSGSGGNDSGDPGGGKVIDCVAPWVAVDLAAPVPCRNGYPEVMCSQVEAADLQVGDMVWTRPDVGGEYGAYAIDALAPGTAPLWAVNLAPDGNPRHGVTTIQASAPHEMLVDGKGWTEVQALEPGDVVLGLQPQTIISTENLVGQGTVVQISVAGANAFETGGLASRATTIPPG